jgi:hypothetical protein
MKITRSFVWDALLVVALLLTAPPALYRLWQTGDVYLFTQQFWADLVARFSAAGRFRFVFQPVTAIILGISGGIRDAHLGLPPFLWSLLFRADQRRKAWGSALAATRDLIALAILLDLISQYLLFPAIHPGAALILGPILIAVPYALARALTNRLMPRSAHRDDHRAAA